MIEDSLRADPKRELTLYWGGRCLEDIYLHELPQKWAASHPAFKYIPVISEPDKNPDWSGRTGFVHKALMEDLMPFAAELLIIAGGSPAMVHAAYDDFKAAGLDKSQMHSDVFAYAPRD